MFYWIKLYGVIIYVTFCPENRVKEHLDFLSEGTIWRTGKFWAWSFRYDLELLIGDLTDRAFIAIEEISKLEPFAPEPSPAEHPISREPNCTTKVHKSKLRDFFTFNRTEKSSNTAWRKGKQLASVQLNFETRKHLTKFQLVVPDSTGRQILGEPKQTGQVWKLRWPEGTTKCEAPSITSSMSCSQERSRSMSAPEKLWNS